MTMEIDEINNRHSPTFSYIPEKVGFCLETFYRKEGIMKKIILTGGLFLLMVGTCWGEVYEWEIGNSSIVGADIVMTITDIVEFKLTSNCAEDNLFNFDFIFWSFIQGEHKFVLWPDRGSDYDDSYAAITCKFCSSNYYCICNLENGLSMEATIYNFPDWFNIYDSFTIKYGDYVLGIPARTPETTTTTTAPDGPTTSISGDGICTSEQIYGENSEQTELLRHIRDSVLSQTPEGQELIRLYYQWSPAIVKAMEEDKEFKEAVKEMIDGVLPLIGKEIE